MQPYKKLYTYWFSVIIYDLTVEFCERWIASYKLKEQMNGAARSGKQNIVEGSDSLKTSLKSGIKLTNVAKASEEELLGDYEDFLRQRNMSVWTKEDSRVKVTRTRTANLVRNLSNLSSLGKDSSVIIKREIPLPSDPENAANLMLTLLHQATYL
jgi:restriction system protein